MSEPEHISPIVGRLIERIAGLGEIEEGWRRRSLIEDSRLEQLERITARQKAHLTVMEEIIRRLPDGERMEHRINQITEALLRQARKEAGSDDGKSEELEGMFR